MTSIAYDRGLRRALPLGILAIAALGLTLPLAGAADAADATATSYSSDSSGPDLIPLLAGYNDFWISAGTNNLHGSIVDSATLSRDDRLAAWINQYATKKQEFKALQDSEYQNATGTAYDQSITVSTGLGAVLGPLYVKGRNSGALPLTTALINSSNGTSGAYVGTGAAKAAFSHPRPFLPSNADATPVPGDDPACAPSIVNASSQKRIRVGKVWADADGNLKIDRVPATTDTTHTYSPNDVTLDAAYGTPGLCTGGSFPSGHATTAYQAGITLATLLPELAPEILTRASEAGNNRIVLGVHYPLDIMGGRIDGEAALAARWSDSQYRAGVLQPARAELVSYLEKACGNKLARCIAAQEPYTSNPYGGREMPGGTAQKVRDRKSAVRVYRERMTYGFHRTGTKDLKASVPAGAANLLRTTFPRLTSKQRRDVLAQTEIGSGYPLDQTLSENGSWERLNLAAAMSATVKITKTGSVRVVSSGGRAHVS